jgi:hypothetical protein
MVMQAVNRRRFLRNAGISLLAAPFVGLLRRPTARAAGTARRLIVWFTPNGTVHRHWRPQGEGADFQFPAGSILEPLSDHRQHLLVLDGIDFMHARATNHEGGMEHMLTGGGNPSIDQYIADQLAAPTPFSSIELSVQTSAWGAGIQTRMSYDASHAYVHPEDDPGAAYRRLFGGVAADTAEGEVDPTQAARQSVIDLVRGELHGLQRRLGHEERVKLEAHLESLRRMERRIAGVSGAGCEAVAQPAVTSPQQNASFPDVGEAQMALLVAAAACDLSRVLSLQWSHTVSPTILSWAGSGEGHHELSHKDDGNTAGVQAFVEAERWFSAQFARFLDMLAEVEEPDGSGSLLDTSTVVWVKELGDSRLHDFHSVPFVIAGRGGGYFAPGRYLRYDADPHQKLLVSLCQSMGLRDETLGAGNVRGPLAGLTG